MIRIIFFLMLAFATITQGAIVTGDPNGKVTLVEFYDYQCPHCRHEASVIHQLQARDPQLRVVYRVISAFGFTSHFEAAAALASLSQQKYSAFSQLLLQQTVAPSPAQVLQLAQSIGLDIPKLLLDMHSVGVENEIASNGQAFLTLGQHQIPLIIIGATHAQHFKKMYTGETAYVVLQHGIDEAYDE